jgi:hypothetical protein
MTCVVATCTHLGTLVLVVLFESETIGLVDSAVLELVTKGLVFDETRLHRLLPQHRTICTLDLKPNSKRKKFRSPSFLIKNALFFCPASAWWKKDEII